MFLCIFSLGESFVVGVHGTSKFLDIKYNYLSSRLKLLGISKMAKLFWQLFVFLLSFDSPRAKRHLISIIVNLAYE